MPKWTILLVLLQAGALDIPISNTQTAVAYCTAAADTLKSNDNLQQDTETMIELFETVRTKPIYKRIRAVALLDRSLGIIDRQRHSWLLLLEREVCTCRAVAQAEKIIGRLTLLRIAQNSLLYISRHPPQSACHSWLCLQLVQCPVKGRILQCSCDTFWLLTASLSARFQAVKDGSLVVPSNQDASAVRFFYIKN